MVPCCARAANGHAAAALPSLAKNFRLRCGLPCDSPVGGHVMEDDTTLALRGQWLRADRPSRVNASNVESLIIAARKDWHSYANRALVGAKFMDYVAMLARRTCGKFSLLMLRTTMRRARTWRWAKTRRWVGQFSGPESLSPFRYCLAHFKSKQPKRIM